MMAKAALPKTVLWVVNLLFIFLLMFTLFRVVTFFAFKPEQETINDLLPSFILGLRFDLRWISLLLLPIIIISLWPQFSPFYSERNTQFWTWYLATITFIVFFFFAADFGCFSYNKTRLNASALNFFEDPSTSASMLWQSYPVIWLLSGLVGAVLLLRWMFWKTYLQIVSKTTVSINYHQWILAAAVAMGLLVYGSTSFQPLSWKNAFVLQDSFKSYLALNPFQNFFTTLRFRKPESNESKARQYFPVMAEWMGLPQEGFSYKRNIGILSGAVHTKPNVVLVLCESFSMYKSSMSGNPLNTTPFFESLCNKGAFFNRCFTPHFSTARGLFATITGIPDVQLSKFSTRNEQALNQHTIINNFTDYQKFYFLGGNPYFNNFIGLLKNINDLQMFAEGRFESKPVNVWGISDRNLFLEANKTFAQQTKPFFAIIQTADNHRPYMIPDEDKDFIHLNIPVDTLNKYGFESLEEFNSFRYTDYCIEKFMNAARKEKYFSNTVFVFLGDHGVSGNAKAVYPDVWTEERLTDEHVPLLFYAPKLLAPQSRSEVVSQIDVLPSVASLTGSNYVNTTLGRNILTQRNKNHYAFIIQHDEGQIGIITDSFYFTKNLNFKKEDLHFLKDNRYTSAQRDSIIGKMSEFTTAFYETAKWMLVNNKK
ncbi:MAG: LTA synthase family protein [Chitinophagaceae bacterium]|nr:LTA synthase family protein [Chitinophagaceae bacterium]